MLNEKQYDIGRRGNTVVLRTTSFRTERRSVLHSGVFNRELASSLAAGAVIVLLSFFFALHYRITFVDLLAAVLIFAALFITFRISVFREALLETVFDGDQRTIAISLKRAIGGRVKLYPMDRLLGIKLDHVSMRPDNIDAVQFVERIAVQHGTVIPGFGMTEDFYTLELDFDGEKKAIFCSRGKQDAESLIGELRSALKGLLHDAVMGGIDGR